MVHCVVTYLLNLIFTLTFSCNILHILLHVTRCNSNVSFSMKYYYSRTPTTKCCQHAWQIKIQHLHQYVR